MAAYWEIAAHSAYDMFSKYKYLIANLVFPPRFLEREFLSDCAFSFFRIIAYLYFLTCCLCTEQIKKRGSPGPRRFIRVETTPIANAEKRLFSLVATTFWQ